MTLLNEAGEALAGELVIPDQYTTTSLSLPAGLDFEEWESIGRHIQKAADASMWWLGDWWAYGDQVYGERAAQALESEYKFQTFMNAAWVCRKIETSRRREVLSFSLHAEVAGQPQEIQDLILDAAVEYGWTQKEIRKAVKDKSGGLKSALDKGDPFAGSWTGKFEWYTPEIYVEAARSAMGGIDLDPASCAYAQKVVKAKRYFTEVDNGLEQAWSGRVWLNPPYKMPAIELFTERLVEHVGRSLWRLPEVTQAILLTNNATDTRWWHLAADAAEAICFTRGRISFYDEDGESSAPTNGQCFFYFGLRREVFETKFEKIGKVVMLKDD